jgi:hypothetical protein
MNILKVIGLIIIAFLLVNLVAYVTTGADLVFYKFWAPKYADAERNVFEHTRAFTVGQTQTLIQYRHQYLMTKSAEDKAIIRNTVMEQFGDLDETTVRSETAKSFLHACRNGDDYSDPNTSSQKF